jgi:predicted acylesterase/phospholipase RssA
MIRKKGIVLSGGAIYGLLHLGAVEKVDKDHLDYFSGSSVGSLICALLACKIPINEIIDKAKAKRILDKNNINIFNIFEHLGIDDSSTIRNWLKDVIGDITFQEIFHTYGTTLFVSVFNVDLLQVEYFSRFSVPDLKVIDAVVMSCSIPLLMTCKIYNNFHYIDCCIARERLPYQPLLEHIDKTDILIINVHFDSLESNVNNLFSYLFRILNYTLRNEKLIPNDIQLVNLQPNGTIKVFDMYDYTNDTIDSLISLGETQMCDYLRRVIE